MICKDNQWYRAYTKDTLPEKAIESFESRYGRKPHEVRDAGTVWLVGPIEMAEICIDEEKPAPVVIHEGQLRLF